MQKQGRHSPWDQSGSNLNPFHTIQEYKQTTIHTCTYIIHTYTYIYIHTHTHTHVHTSTRSVRISKRVATREGARNYVHTHTRTHTHTHTRTYTYRYTHMKKLKLTVARPPPFAHTVDRGPDSLGHWLTEPSTTDVKSRG